MTAFWSRVRRVVSLVALGIVTLVVFACGDSPVELSTSQPLLTYVHPQGGWSINYPATWEVQDYVGPADDWRRESAYFGKTINQRSYSGSFPQLRVTRFVGLSLGKDAKETAWEYLFDEPVWGIVPWHTSSTVPVRVSVGGHPAYEYVATYRLERRGEIRSIVLKLFMIVDRDRYEVSAEVSSQSLWNKSEDLMRKLAYSLRPPPGER